MSKIKRLAALVVSLCMVTSVGLFAACVDDETVGGDDGSTVDSGTDGTTDSGSSDSGSSDSGSSDSGSSDSGSSDSGSTSTAGLSLTDLDAYVYTNNSILDDGESYTYNTYTSVSPSNWNILTYEDSNDTQIMNYIHSSLFEYDYEFDEDGNIISGSFNTEFSAVTALEDVTDDYAEEWGLTDAQVATGGYAWKLTLREDLAWDDGTAITAADFVYSMMEQLNPLFLNYRADSYYNSSVIIHNARSYVYQGQSGWFAADTAYSEYTEDLDSQLVFTLGNATENASTYDGAYVSFLDTFGFTDAGYTAAQVRAYLETYYGFDADELASLEGKTFAEIKADSTLYSIWSDLIGWWQTDPDEELDFFVVEYTFPEVDFGDVGIFVGDTEYELVLVLDSNLSLLKEDENGEVSLSYIAAYNLASLPLVKEDLYESCKVAPSTGSSLWTSTYCTSVETTASWGPYSLTQFQGGTSYTLTRNESWYGYQLEKYEGQYETDTIYCRTLSEWNTAWQAFQLGNLDTITMDTTIADDYKNSSHALFTASDYVGSMQLQSSAEALKARETSGVDKEMLTYVKFRKALSLAIDRADFAATCTTASQAGFGLFNSMHYYDVENGGVYRNEEVAMEVILRVYGATDNGDGTWTVGSRTYDDIVEAYDAITGYDLTLARQLLEEAYQEALAAGTISETDTVVLTIGFSTSSESATRIYNYLKSAFETLAVGTSLEGRLTVEMDTTFGSSWATSFRNGEYDICLGGWTGAAWDPGYFLLAYLDADYMYSTAWDTETETMTFTMPEGDYDGAGQTLTMSLMNWYRCLNGTTVDGDTYTYNWSSGVVDDSVRLELIAALEEAILEQYYTIPLYNSYDAELYSYKVEFISTEYNTFMSYGGIRYMTYNYTDAEWATYIASTTLDYTV